MEPPDPSALLVRAIESGSGIRFARGVVGKTGHAIVGLIIVWAIVAIRLGSGIVLDCFLIGVGLLITSVFIWWTRSIQQFAERNPGQAVLDGAEFVEYTKMKAVAKSGAVEFGTLASEDAPTIEGKDLQ